jgi:hypothetical protein
MVTSGKAGTYGQRPRRATESPYLDGPAGALAQLLRLLSGGAPE